MHRGTVGRLSRARFFPRSFSATSTAKCGKQFFGCGQPASHCRSYRLGRSRARVGRHGDAVASGTSSRRRTATEIRQLKRESIILSSAIRGGARDARRQCASYRRALWRATYTLHKYATLDGQQIAETTAQNPRLLALPTGIPWFCASSSGRFRCGSS